MTHLNGAWLGGLSWSPDGRRIAFDGRQGRNSRVYVVPASGGTPQPIEESTQEERMPNWSPDGRWVYFNSSRSGQIAVWRKPVGGGAAEPVLENAFQVQSGPDGRLYFDRPNQPGLWTAAPNGADPKPLLSPDNLAPHLNWTVSPEGIITAGIPNAAHRIALLRFGSDHVTEMGSAQFDFIADTPGLCASPTGDSILFAVQEYISRDISIRSGPVMPH